MRKFFLILMVLFFVSPAQANVFECGYNTIDGVPIVSVLAFDDGTHYKKTALIRSASYWESFKKTQIARKVIAYEDYETRNYAFAKCKALAKDFEIIYKTYSVDSSWQFPGGSTTYPCWKKKSTGEVSDDRWLGSVFIPTLESQVEEVVDLIVEELEG